MNSGFNAKTKLSDEWETPNCLFQSLDLEFGFTLDGAATAENTKCDRFVTASRTDPDLVWTGERVFCNPPYSAIEPFVRRAFLAEVAVLILPVRSDSRWFRILRERKVELRFFRKRICFLQNGKPVKSPRFSTVLAIVSGSGTA